MDLLSLSFPSAEEAMDVSVWLLWVLKIGVVDGYKIFDFPILANKQSEGHSQGQSTTHRQVQ